MGEVDNFAGMVRLLVILGSVLFKCRRYSIGVWGCELLYMRDVRVLPGHHQFIDTW